MRIMSRYGSEPFPPRPNVSNDWARISALRHVIAGYRFQFVSGVFPGTADHGGIRNQPHRRTNEPARFDHGSDGISAAGEPKHRFRISREARAGSVETCAGWMGGDAAGRFAGDAVVDGRHS